MKEPLFYRIIRPIVTFLVKLVFRPNYIGLENIPKSGRIIDFILQSPIPSVAAFLKSLNLISLIICIDYTSYCCANKLLYKSNLVLY